MIELIAIGICTLAAMCLGAYIYCRGLREGADIVWRTSGGDKPSLFDSSGSDFLSQATTEEMDSDLLADERNESGIGAGMGEQPNAR